MADLAAIRAFFGDIGQFVLAAAVAPSHILGHVA